MFIIGPKQKSARSNLFLWGEQLHTLAAYLSHRYLRTNSIHTVEGVQEGHQVEGRGGSVTDDVMLVWSSRGQ